MQRPSAEVFRTVLLLFILTAAVAPGISQSGRKGTDPKVLPTPKTTSSGPEKIPLQKTSRPQLPKIVDGERIYVGSEVDERLHILAKPEPVYTPQARRHKTSGTVLLRAILAADQKVKHIEVISGLPYGLSDQAIQAARLIKFTPAKKDGKAVPCWVELEYGFNIY